MVEHSILAVGFHFGLLLIFVLAGEDDLEELLLVVVANASVGDELLHEEVEVARVDHLDHIMGK